MNPNVIDKLLLSGEAKSQNVPANQSLFCLGDECEHFVIVRDGTVRVELLSTTGQQMLLYRIEDGQSCVMTTSCLLGNSQYFAQALTETPVELVLITRASFNNQLAESAEFRDFVFSGFHERFAGLMSRTTELVTSTVDQRLAAALLAIADANGASTAGASKQIDQTHQQLAVDIGSAREVVSRRLASFEKNGLIAKSRGNIEILNADKLRNLLPN